jgi:hypothetical protein
MFQLFRNRALRTIVVVLVATLGSFVQSVSAASLSINGGAAFGSITTVGPNAFSNASVGGVNFWANYTLDGGQTQVVPADLRWLQLVTFSKAVTGFPNRPFIDPRQGQAIGGGNTGDNQPWYDITGNTQAGISASGRGVGTWMGDGPQAPWTAAPLTFTADTLVVTILDATNKVAEILGGVEWGYSITSPAGTNTVTPAGPTDLTVNIALRDAFNTQLANDFNGWTVIVPEPTTQMLLIAAMAVFALVGSRRALRRMSILASRR